MEISWDNSGGSSVITRVNKSGGGRQKAECCDVKSTRAVFVNIEEGGNRPRGKDYG